MALSLDINTIVVVVSCGVTVGSMILNNRTIIRNLDEKIQLYKTDMEGRLKMEKEHAISLAEVRFRSIEKDVDEMFPRLRATEDSTQANSLTIHQIHANCIRHRLKTNGGTP